MRQNYITTIAILVILTFSGCSKDDFDLFKDPSENAVPQVKMLSAVMVDEQTALLTADILHGGKAPLEVNGFCFSATNPHPGVYDNQIIQGGKDGIFQEFVGGLLIDSTYYFRAFTANEYGYSYSINVVKLKVPRPEPVIAPCTLPEDKMLDNGFTLAIDGVDDSYYDNKYLINVSCYFSGNRSFKLYFNKMPNTGVYKTVDYSDVEWKEKGVHMEVKTGFNVFKVNEGYDVFVNKNSDGSYKIELCNSMYQITSTAAVELKGHITFTP
jgi:hypothetical protein